ncbi:MAG: protein kinase [Bacteroidetes bacterium]|nr:protein kinase [Bacteroidota bacterium]
MRKGDIIGGYHILQDFIVAGGMSKISFAKRGDTEYFIKEFLSPKYPIKGAPGSPASIARKQKRCDEFEAHHKKLNDAIGSKCAFGGNLVYAIDFFRAETSYYKVTEKIDVASLSLKDISTLPIEKILIILKTVTHSLKILHDLKIVHGDLKPDNILIKQTKTGGYTTKLIDFDNSYFSEEPPENTEEVVGTPEYYSPELAAYIKIGETAEDRKKLTIQSDIFALGIIFTEYLTGEKPQIPDKYTYLWEAINDNSTVKFKGGGRSTNLKDLLLSMIQKNQNKRPTISKVFEALKHPEILKEIIKDSSVEVSKPLNTTKSKLKISSNLQSAMSKEEKKEDTPPAKPSNLKIKGLNID